MFDDIIVKKINQILAKDIKCPICLEPKLQETEPTVEGSTEYRNFVCQKCGSRMSLRTLL